jgi:hypothetical protein
LSTTLGLDIGILIFALNSIRDNSFNGFPENSSSGLGKPGPASKTPCYVVARATCSTGTPAAYTAVPSWPEMGVASCIKLRTPEHNISHFIK